MHIEHPFADLESKFRNNLISQGFIQAKYIPDFSVYITKLSLIKVIFPNTTTQQKILKRFKKLNIWNTQNDLFELKEYNFKTCDKRCPHEYGYCDSIRYTQEVLKLTLENIPDEMKVKDFNCYWINSDVFTQSLII